MRSVGAQWLDLGIDAAGEGGYARELTEEERAQQQKKLEEAITRLRRGDHHRAGAGPSRRRGW